MKWGVGWVEGIGGKVLEERYWRIWDGIMDD